MKKIKVGIIGCGTIGSDIAKACRSTLKDSFELVALCDIDADKADALAKSLGGGVSVVGMDELIKGSDIVVEAASAAISAEALEKSASAGKGILIMSVGGLIGREGLLEKARSSGARVFIPSGALCGIDGLKASSCGKINSVTLTTRKSPKGLEGAPYLEEKNIDLSKVRGETVVFEGTAEEAVRGFPKNVNVCAVLSLAGIGAVRTKVRIITSPDYTKNIHEVEISGDSGKIFTRTENVPSPTNTKTSYMAVLSAIAALKGIAEGVRIGT